MYVHMVILFIEYFGLAHDNDHIYFYDIYNCKDCIYGEQYDCMRSGSDLNHVSCLETRAIW